MAQILKLVERGVADAKKAKRGCKSAEIRPFSLVMLHL